MKKNLDLINEIIDFDPNENKLERKIQTNNLYHFFFKLMKKVMKVLKIYLKN